MGTVFEPILAGGSGINEGVGVCFFVGAVVAIIIAAVALSNSQGKQLNDSFGRFARQFRGTFRPGDWSDTPAVSFEHNTSSALLDISRQGRSSWCTQITFAFRRPAPVTMEIDPDGVDKPQLRMLKMQPSPTGDMTFDYGHRVYSSDRNAARDLLTPSIREDLMRVRESLGGLVNICVSRDYLLVRYPSRVRDYSHLMIFAHVAFQVHDQLLLVVNQADADEVQIVEVQGPDAPGAVVAEDAKCGVCGEPAIEDRVLCRCCRAPHHRDCWDYNRGCSVYACRERTYIRPEAPNPSDRPKG